MQINNFDVNGTIDSISDYAPVILFFMMVTMFGMTGWLQYKFLDGVFIEVIPEAQYLVFFFPIVIQVLRFVTGFLSASFLKKGSYFYGIIVLLFSIWLSAFEYNQVDEMAEYWTSVDLNLSDVLQSDIRIRISKSVISEIMMVLIWGAMVLEFFLAAWVGQLKDDIFSEGSES